MIYIFFCSRTFVGLCQVLIWLTSGAFASMCWFCFTPFLVICSIEAFFFFFCSLFGSIFISCTATSPCQSVLPAADSNLTSNLIGLIHRNFNLPAANLHIYVHCRLSSLFNLIAYLCLHFRIHLMAASRVVWKHILQSFHHVCGHIAGTYVSQQWHSLSVRFGSATTQLICGHLVTWLLPHQSHVGSFRTFSAMFQKALQALLDIVGSWEAKMQ